MTCIRTQVVVIFVNAEYLLHKIDIKRTRLTSGTLKIYFLLLPRESAPLKDAEQFFDLMPVIQVTFHIFNCIGLRHSDSHKSVFLVLLRVETVT